MLMASRLKYTPGMLLVLSGIILLTLGGCHYTNPKKATPPTITKDDGGGTVVAAVDDDCGARGCNPTAYAGSALGFVGIGGTSPVPAGYTCNAGSVKCANEGATGCSLRYPNRKCKTTFTYQGGGSTTGPCSCQCLNP